MLFCDFFNYNYKHRKIKTDCRFDSTIHFFIPKLLKVGLCLWCHFL